MFGKIKAYVAEHKDVVIRTTALVVGALVIGTVAVALHNGAQESEEGSEELSEIPAEIETDEVSE